MSAYLLCGLSGTGKTTTANELSRRGYNTVNTDDVEYGISYYRNSETGLYVDRPYKPPFTEAWLAAHTWVWNGDGIRAIIDSASSDIFLCGDATNETEFYPLFTKIFGLVADDEVIIERLQVREPERWADGSPDLAEKLTRNHTERKRLQLAGAILIDASQPTSVIADQIIGNL